jgi:hypothetical protein
MLIYLCPICFIFDWIDRHNNCAPYSNQIKGKHHAFQRSLVNKVNENSDHQPGGSFRQAKSYLNINNLYQVSL